MRKPGSAKKKRTSSSAARVRRRANRLPRERRENDILDAALAVFRQRGFARAGISEIAERAGLVEGSIYRYFENKRDLLAKVIERWYAAVITSAEEGVARTPAGRARLRFVIWHHLKVIADEPMLSWLVFSEFRPDPGYRGTRIFALNRRYAGKAMDVVQEGIKAGIFRADLPAGLVRDLIFGTIEHHTWAFLRGERRLDIDAAADAITDLIFRSLKATGR